MLLGLTPTACDLIEVTSQQIAQLNDMALASMSREMMNKLIPLLATLSGDVEKASRFADFLLRSKQAETRKVRRLPDPASNDLHRRASNHR